MVAQQNDPVLFSVDGTPVRVSEFDYIYAKTNGAEANYSEASLQEYLDLYIKFKLKVKKAKDLQLDTIQELKRELSGYRRQLADSYLINKEVTERLIKEVYDRKQQDVDISHIFFQLPKDPLPGDTLKAYQRALSVKTSLDQGEKFETLARNNSDDRSAQKNGGRIGFVSAMFPPGYYNFESAAYTLPLSTVSNPVRTANGYHLVFVHGRRPARGEVEASHILLRTQNKDKTQVKAQIDSIYQALGNGANFESLAQQYSEDARTATKGGYIGFVAINRFQLAFEDAVFSIEEDNTYSAPFESSLGYHIVKRISKKALGSLEEESKVIEGLIKRDGRFDASKVAMIENIKRNANYQAFPIVLERFIQTQNDTLFTFRWKGPREGKDGVLFNLGEEKYSVADFGDYLKKNTRNRLRLNGSSSVANGIRQLFDEFVNDACMRFEESQLENKYPDFKSLMREYEEGILLFEVTKRNVWDKAAQDTTGLKAFHKTVADKYQWKKRAKVTKYVLPKRSQALLQVVKEYATDNEAAAVLEKYKSANITIEEETLEEGKGLAAANLKEWKEGYISNGMSNVEEEVFYFMKVDEIIPAREKTLSEARGYIIADYQDYLEKQWVEELRKEYEVEIDQKQFKGLIK